MIGSPKGPSYASIAKPISFCRVRGAKMLDVYWSLRNVMAAESLTSQTRSSYFEDQGLEGARGFKSYEMKNENY